MTPRTFDPKPPSSKLRCNTCGGGGAVLCEEMYYATHEMALDAGDLDLEGYPIPMKYWDTCPCCAGDGLQHNYEPPSSDLAQEIQDEIDAARELEVEIDKALEELTK